MKTVVYQSYRTSNVAPWITRCMESVKSWSILNGFEYRFIDDRIFDYVPSSYKEKARNNMLLMTDLGRLELARELLDEGFERTVWVDADVIIFNPPKFSVDIKEDFAFCREVWIHHPKLFGVTLPITRCNFKVNNAVSVFTASSTMLDSYRMSCHSLVENMPRVFDPGFVSTTYLTSLHKQNPLPLLTNVALLSPLVLHDLANGGGRYARLFMEKFAYPVYAANLCSTMNNGKHMGIRIHNGMYDGVINRLLETKGGILNQYLPR